MHIEPSRLPLPSIAGSTTALCFTCQTELSSQAAFILCPANQGSVDSYPLLIYAFCQCVQYRNGCANVIPPCLLCKSRSLFSSRVLDQRTLCYVKVLSFGLGLIHSSFTFGLNHSNLSFSYMNFSFGYSQLRPLAPDIPLDSQRVEPQWHLQSSLVFSDYSRTAFYV